jgi:hypothetical protein
MDFFGGIAGYTTRVYTIPQVEYTPGTGIPPAKHTPAIFKTVQDYVFRPLGKDGRRLFSHFTICSFEVMFSLKSMFTVTYNKVNYIKGEFLIL